MPDTITRGGPNHCAICGAMPTHETAEKADDTSAGPEHRWTLIVSRYCARHAPMGARIIPPEEPAADHVIEVL